jgi:monoamine oxidase
MTQQTEILIIGAGASGLMAARKLSKAGKKVLVLEARDRAGGRIHTCMDNDFMQPVELGAEFVHGQLPVTLHLLEEAGIPYHNSAGDMWRFDNGILKQTEQFLPEFDLLLRKMSELKEDCSVDTFLNTHFTGDKYEKLRSTLRSFAAGYDTADPARFSVFAMRKELQSEDDDHQYRIEGGYVRMINFLVQEIKAHGGEIQLAAVVNEVQWQQGSVIVTTSDGKKYSAKEVIITIPLNVLTDSDNKGAISFLPAIPAQQNAIRQMGMGAVVKTILQFDTVFWEEQAIKQGADESIKNMGYLFSDQPIPTWWTQKPNHLPVLTGWIGGPPAAALRSQSDEAILQLGLQSLAAIFGMNEADVKRQLTAHKIMNWTADPFTLGSYSYATVESVEARNILLQGVDNTIFFAGEAIYDGPEMGTVEAALASGLQVAELIS